MIRLLKSVIARRLALGVLAAGIPPVAALMIIALSAVGGAKEAVDERLVAMTQALIGHVEQTLDEQAAYVRGCAVAAELALHGGSDSYAVDSKEGVAARLTRLMDGYARANRDAYLMVFADTDGRVVAASGSDRDGRSLNIGALSRASFRDAPWLTAWRPVAGSMPAAEAFVEDVTAEPLLAGMFPDDDGLALGFSAPVRYADGRLAGVWKTYVRFEAVEHAFEALYASLASAGQGGAEMTLLDRAGRVLIDYEPQRTGSREVTHDFSVLFQLDLVAGGVVAAKRAVAGESGSIVSTHARKKIDQVSGFGHLSGGAAADAVGWSVLVRVPVSEGYRVSAGLQWKTLVAGVAGLALLAILAAFLGGRLASPVVRLAAQAKRVAAGELATSEQRRASDETGILAAAIDDISAKLQGFTGELRELTSSARRGELDRRVAVDRYAGAYREVMEGVNELMDTVVAPIQEVRGALEVVATGDLRARINDDYAGDFASLKDAWNASFEALGGVLSDAVATAAHVAAGSVELRENGQSMAQQATEQAATIEEISAQMTQMASQTQDNAGRAARASGLAIEARCGTERGHAAMEEMVAAMEAITTSSKSISRVIRVIDEIAFQTNLLALNAAVEAARAGVHGAGFGVVAEEVRNLAARSAAAARETGELVATSVEHVANGTRIAHSTATALDAILAQAGGLHDQVAGIADASREQAEGIGQITEGLAAMSGSVMANTAATEESAAAVEFLASHAEDLASKLARFVLSAPPGRTQRSPQASTPPAGRGAADRSATRPRPEGAARGSSSQAETLGAGRTPPPEGAQTRVA